MARIRRDAVPELADGQVCAMFAVDIADYTSRDEEIQLFLRRALYQMLAAAFTASGVPWERCRRQDRGDGALVVIPPGTPSQSLISPLPAQLENQLRSHNRIVTEPARMQLRAAIHIGPVYRDAHGLAGEDLNMVCRILDARPLRRALADSGAGLALVVSGHFYDTVIRRHPSITGAAAFRPFRTTVKRTRVHAWIHMPGRTR
jgi:class 3 adenylate cyclase